MKVVVTSRETIKPSRPTPPHLRRLELSYLDQIQQPHFVPFVYFYASSDSGELSVTTAENNHNKPTNQRRGEQLKKSLAETLSWFYPLAGRVKDNFFVDCNDDGVPYFEAQANCNLDQVVGSHSHLNNLFPYPDFDDAGNLLLAIQVNFFDCGGIAIGLCTSHKMADALSVVMFVKFWAAVSRGDHSNMICPQFGAATFFPPRAKPNTAYYERGVGTTKKKIVGKSFMFSGPTISALKAKYAFADATTNKKTIYPSRVESLSTFIWCRYVAITRGGEASEAVMYYPVILGTNLRTRLNPPLPDSYYGNFSRFATAFVSLNNKCDIDEEGCGLVAQMRDALRNVDSDFVRKLQERDDMAQKKKEGGGGGGGDGGSKLSEGGRKSFHLTFSSLSRFPLYETDFGWGRPVWVTLAVVNLENIVVFKPTRSGDGIEAVFGMNEDHLAKLEADKEFMSFVSSTPSSNAKFPLLSCL